MLREHAEILRHVVNDCISHYLVRVVFPLSEVLDVLITLMSDLVLPLA
jgi:hypothetical protein